MLADPRQRRYLSVVLPTVAVVLFLLPLFLCYLWNTTMPGVFGLPPLGYWQMFRLFLLVSSFTGGTGAVVRETAPHRREYVLGTGGR